jgi:ribosomal protein S18 acetylase RimI-like enzyme
VIDARRIEEAGLNALQTQRQLFYDGWLLRVSPGKAKRARSVNAHFGSTLPLDEKVARCEDVYAAHGLSTLFRVTPLSQPGTLDAALAARGYVSFDETLVQHAPLRPPAQVAQRDGLALAAVTVAAFVEEVGRLRGSPSAQRAAHLERLADSPLDLAPVVARHEGVVVGAGMLSSNERLGGLFDIVVAGAMQGRGIGSAIVAALFGRATERGVADLFLQVTADNAAAIALYRRFGFSTLYRYHYRARGHEVE